MVLVGLFDEKDLTDGTDKKAAVCAFYDLTIETTKKEKEQRQRAAARIADKRKSDPDYARPEREHKKRR